MTEPAGSVGRNELVEYLDGLLAAVGVQDACPNGLQVEGAETIRTVVTGVSACVELFARAAELGAQAVLVHHGLFWNGQEATLTGIQRRRVDPLIVHGMNLIAYHLPLDSHAQLGNNAVAVRRLGLVDHEPFGDYHGAAIGFRGRFETPIDREAMISRCRDLFGQTPLALGDGPALIENVGVVSGGAAALLHQAIDQGLDAYVTGEPVEWATNIAREARILFLAAGHYATERLGVQALGDHLRERFALEVEFVDVPNPV